MEDTKEKSTVKTPLKNKKVKVYPIKRARGLVQDAEHEAAFLFGDSTFEFSVPMTRTGKLKDPLDPEEREYFEKYDKQLNFREGDTSIYPDKDGNNMWYDYRIRLDKTVRELDLSDPQDYLDWKVLLANEDKIAPSWNERHDKQTYLYALVDEEEETKSVATQADKRKRAYKHYGKIEEDPDEMKKFLRIYGAKPPQNAKMHFLQSEIDRIIQEDLDGFLSVIEDDDYDIRDFIDQAIQVGALHKNRNEYKLPGGDIIGRSTKDTIDFLNDPKNQDIYLDIQAKIEAAD